VVRPGEKQLVLAYRFQPEVMLERFVSTADITVGAIHAFTALHQTLPGCGPEDFPHAVLYSGGAPISRRRRVHSQLHDRCCACTTLRADRGPSRDHAVPVGADTPVDPTYGARVPSAFPDPTKGSASKTRGGAVCP